MAAKYYGVAVGGKIPTDVTQADSTNSTAYEFVIQDSAYTSKQAALDAIKAIEMYIIERETQPIA